MAINLTLLRGVSSFAAGKFDNGRGTTGVWGIATASAWDSSVGGTIECWIKRSGATITQQVIGNGTSAHMGVEATGGLSGNWASGATLNSGGSGNLNDGNWHHIATVLDGANYSIYADGVRIATRAQTGGMIWTGGTYAIGGFGTNATLDYTGQIDEVRISRFPRYTGATYTVPTAPFVSDLNTIALYHLEADGTDSHIPPVPVGGIYPAFTTPKVMVSYTPLLTGPHSPLLTSGVIKTFNGDGFIYKSPLEGQLFPRGDYAPL